MLPNVFHAYIAFLGKSLGSYLSLKNYLSALKKINLLLGADVEFMNDTGSNMLKRALRKILGENMNRKEEITIQLLSRICSILNASVPLHACMKVIFLVAFFSFLRKSNLLPRSVGESLGEDGMFLKRRDVSFTKDGAILRIYRTKTLLFRSRVLSVPIPKIAGSMLCPVGALRHHLALSPGSQKDSLFSLAGHSGSKPVLAGHAVKFLKECIKFLGYNENVYSMHSFRRGGATFAFRAGAPSEFIKAQGDWMSDAFLVYSVISPQDKTRILQSITARLAHKSGM